MSPRTCAKCKKVLGRASKWRRCRDCKASYCESHFEIGEWQRLAITQDDEVRFIECPEGHDSHENR